MSATAVESAGSSGLSLAWRRWRHWQKSRPFWGGLFVLLGAGVTLLSERAPLPLIIHIGLQGAAGYLVPTVLLLIGLLLWFNPSQRTFYSLLAIVLALASWITSNLGGFFVGMLLGLLGGSLAFAWEQRGSAPVPVRKPPAGPPPRERLVRLSELFRRSGEQSESGAADHEEPGPAPHRADDGSRAAAVADPPRREIGPLGYQAVAVPVLVAALATLAGQLHVGPPGMPLPKHRNAPSARPPATLAATARSSLTARSAHLTGLAFDGVAEVRTVGGRVAMLRFSFANATLSGGSLQSGSQPGGSLPVSEMLGSLGGHVVLYTTKITADLGGKTVTYTAKRPPTSLPRNVTFADLIIGQPYLTSGSVQASSLKASSLPA